MHYNLRFATPGTYTLWLYGAPPDAAGDSVHIGLENILGGQDPQIVSMSGFVPRQWSWANSELANGESATLTVGAPGLYTLHLWAREDGLRLDRLLLTTDGDYAPSEHSPVESARSEVGDGITWERPPVTISYGYDPLYRLTWATYSSGEVYTYTYDAVGNRLKMGVNGDVTEYAYDAANRLTGVDGVEYTWDDRGNLLSNGTFTCTYDAAGQMVGVQSVTTTLVYTYNAQGLRVAEASDGELTEFAWDVAFPLAQVLYTSDGMRDVYGLGRIGEIRDDVWAYPLPDALSSARQWTDERETVVFAAGYTPYGQPMWQRGDSSSRWGYTGEWMDANTGVVYLRARWYDPQMGSFLSRDAIRRNHPYQYANGNPVLYTDASGLSPLQGEDWGQVFYGGYIEDLVAKDGTPLFGIRTHGQEDWLRVTKEIPGIKELLVELFGLLTSDSFSSGTLRELYEYTRERARVWLDEAYVCIQYPDLEYAHAALIVLAYFPATHGEDPTPWRGYPLFMPDGREKEAGWDKAGHFFLNAFTAFEGKYSAEYAAGKELDDITWMDNLMSWIIGSNNIAAIEADYLRNTDAPYVGGEGLTGDDEVIFDSLVTIGNAYELLTSARHLKLGEESSQIEPEILMKLMLADRVLNGGKNIDALVKALLQLEKTDELNEGLLDSGVYRDHLANRLGVRFGLQVFSAPALTPAIPYDVGRAGCECSTVNGQDVCRYDFP